MAAPNDRTKRVVEVEVGQQACHSDHSVFAVVTYEKVALAARRSRCSRSVAVGELRAVNSAALLEEVEEAAAARLLQYSVTTSEAGRNWH